MNALIFILSVFLFLGLLLLCYKIFGKSGIYAFVIFATILANIQASKSIEIFGFTTTAGSVLYASTFLCTDILSEKYGKKASKKAVYLGIMTTILWLIGTQITILFKPGREDFINESLKVVFGIVPRLSIASLIAYVFSQSVDVFLYHFIWRKTGNSKKGLWIRNNGSTMVSQLVDTTIFISIGFLGTYTTGIFFEILLTTYIFKIIVAALDTPFLYLARMITPLDEIEKNVSEELVNE